MRKRLITVTFMVILIIATLLVLPIRFAPKGTPTDYFDKLDAINDKKLPIYVEASAGLLHEDLHKTTFTSFSNIPHTVQHDAYIVINFATIDFTADDAEEVDALYNDHCYKVILINYGSSGVNALNYLIDPDDTNYDFIVLDFVKCGLYNFTSTNASEDDSLEQINYTIMQIIYHTSIVD